MDDSDLTDRAVEAALTGPQNCGGGFYRYEKYGVTLADRQAVSLTRDVVRVGRVVVIVAVDLACDVVVLIREFRLGAHLAIGRGDVVEMPAGRVERGEELIAAARRECQEEIGATPTSLVPIFSVMPSPGMSDELMSFFLATVDAAKVPERAGVAHEQEETRPICVPIGRALAALSEGGLHYGATVFGLQWLALNRARLGEIVRAGEAVQ
jgi:ADP-ribose pyrophosphatase